MDEKILIRSEKMNTANFLLKWFAIAAAPFFALGIVVAIINVEKDASVLLVPFASGVIFGTVLTIPAIIFYFMYKKMELIVTDKRVYGFAAFGKRVDLPMDSITAISTSMLKGIGVSTASGRIKFAFIKNRDEIQRVLSKQIMDRQYPNANKSSLGENVGSSITELKQYKELLDTGVITQEEFEKKKEQLLK